MKGKNREDCRVAETIGWELRKSPRLGITRVATLGVSHRREKTRGYN